MVALLPRIDLTEIIPESQQIKSIENLDNAFKHNDDQTYHESM